MTRAEGRLSPQGRPGQQPGPGGLVCCHGGQHVRRDAARPDGVDPDAVLGKRQRHASGQVVDTALAGIVPSG